MRMVRLVVVMWLLPTACLAAEETMLLTLFQTTVDNTAAQRQFAVFKSNEESPRTFFIPLSFSADKVGKNERNIIMLVRQFPLHRWERTKHGRKSNPRGTLSFTVPRRDPASQIPEWELARLIVTTPQPLYDGFKNDQAALRKTVRLPVTNAATDTVNASSPEACQAAGRVFGRVSFLLKKRDEVLKLLGDPATISDYNEKAKAGPNEPLIYVFDTGLGGLRYTLKFRNGTCISVQAESGD